MNENSAMRERLLAMLRVQVPTDDQEMRRAIAYVAAFLDENPVVGESPKHALQRALQSLPTETSRANALHSLALNFDLEDPKENP